MAKVVQEDSSIPQESGGIGCMFSHIPKLHYDWRFHGVCAICHVYPWLAKPFDNEQLGSTLWKCFLSHGTSYLSSNNQTWKILGMIFYVYLKEYTAKIRNFKKSVSRYQTHQYIVCQGIELSESDKESTGKASIEKMWRSSHQRSIWFVN